MKLLKKIGATRSADPYHIRDLLEAKFKKLGYDDYETALVLDGFPLLTAVSKAGGQLPVVMVLNKSKLATAKTIVIGKGVCYDTGGLYNKPYPYMSGMFYDKTGAILAAEHALLTPEVPSIIFLTNNMIDRHAYLNGDVIKSRSGVRVEIGHTDAEGRLGLADCITYAKELAPQAIPVSIATLTGAAVSFTGSGTYALLHSYDVNLKLDALSAAENVGLQLWPAPTHKKYKENVKSRLRDADITNSGKDREAGSQSAFEFLRHFNDKLVHLDIAALDTDDDGNFVGGGLKELTYVVEFLKMTADIKEALDKPVKWAKLKSKNKAKPKDKSNEQEVKKPKRTNKESKK